jgi:hypothetical protein
MDTGRRKEHPFHMYDAILDQPEAFVRVLERNRAGSVRHGFIGD